MGDAIAPTTHSFRKVTWGATLRIWCAWTWRWVLFSLAANVVLYLPTLGLMLLLGGTQRAVNLVSMVVGPLVIAVAQAYTLWNLFGRSFSGFELVLEERQGTGVAGAPNILAPTLRQGIRVWWAWFWRQFLLANALVLVLAYGGLVVALSVAMPAVAPGVLGLVVGLAITLLIGFLVLRVILEKDFGKFRIRLLAPPPTPEESFPASGLKLSG